MNLKYAAALTVAASLTMAVAAEARSFKVTPDIHSQTEASFTSRAVLVKFSGHTSHVDGDGAIDVDHPSVHPQAKVVVDLTTLDTGIPLRNEHMKGFLEASKYPTATFTLKSLKAPRLLPNHEVEGTVTGTLTIHGVTHVVAAPVSLTYMPETDKNYRPGDWVSMSTAFKIKLSDYGISLPKQVLGLKVNDNLDLALDGMAKAL